MTTLTINYKNISKFLLHDIEKNYDEVIFNGMLSENNIYADVINSPHIKNVVFDQVDIMGSLNIPITYNGFLDKKISVNYCIFNDFIIKPKNPTNVANLRELVVENSSLDNILLEDSHIDKLSVHSNRIRKDFCLRKTNCPNIYLENNSFRSFDNVS